MVPVLYRFGTPRFLYFTVLEHNGYCTLPFWNTKVHVLYRFRRHYGLRYYTAWEIRCILYFTVLEHHDSCTLPFWNTMVPVLYRFGTPRFLYFTVFQACGLKPRFGLQMVRNTTVPVLYRFPSMWPKASIWASNGTHSWYKLLFKHLA